ncbi:hypothetical protein [Pseudarthrobacter sp. NamE5]|uniref:hypothetical protein n=1 Tax=Pseudarthrobacter sp. NamE5 TaxID=2576839 RepID=UPI00110B4A85|nr:hypothetical protein [Pseudarthrobacter sp. NamE5]TLM87204.1 hypothetical protein FDW84_05255 [Pseudarthrobacter sp. NamE5]
MDLQWLVPLGTFLGVIGGGVGWWINRADKRRESREAQVIQTLKDRIKELQDQIANLTRKLNRRTRAGDRWREQLVENHIKPDPVEWPKDDDDE